MKLNRMLLPAMAAAWAVQIASAQEITPKWFQQINATFGVAEADKLPILVKRTEQEDNQDGTELISAYAGLLRYDATRLLLEVRENGINETDPGNSEADKALAAAYPDRSLIWIDAATGKPLGLAWSESLNSPSLIGIDVTAANQGDRPTMSTIGGAWHWTKARMDKECSIASSSI